MTLHRLSLCLGLAALASGLIASVAVGAGRDLMGGPLAAPPGLPLGLESMPPNTAPGDCVTRRVTGPAGAYRWERIECDAERGWVGFDQWGYGHRPLNIETAPPPAPQVNRYEQQRHEAVFEEGHEWRSEDQQQQAYPLMAEARPGQGVPREDRYGAPRSPRSDYRYAGRDADGYLVWPGKRP
jgi:hypothetical protein